MADRREALIALLDPIKGRKYAVVDAAHFDELQTNLTDAGLPYRPLYLDELGKNMDAAGPHLVELPDRGAARRLLAIVGDKPAVVWWVWPDDGKDPGEAIYEHLRTINMVEIPTEPESDSPDEDEEAEALDTADTGPADHGHDHHSHEHPPQPKPRRYDLVVFRHADSSVMEMVLPILDAHQVSRLFGEALAIVLSSDQSNTPSPQDEKVDENGFIVFARPAILPPLPPGWLRIRPRQIQALNAAKLDPDAKFSYWYVEEFMRHKLAEYYYAVSDEGKREMVLNGRRYAKSFGLRDSQSQAHFVTLMWTIGPNFFLSPGFKEITYDEKMDGPAKIAAYYDVDRQLAADAIMNADDRYWYPEMISRKDQKRHG